MTRQTRLRPEFVTFAPPELESGVLYVSMEYATALHACCCGCGNKVVTPLAPDRWRLSFDGRSISLDPSIGNWSFACQSHYWIEDNSVVWDRRFTGSEIARVRAADRRAIELSRSAPARGQSKEKLVENSDGLRQAATRWWHQLLRRVRGLG